MSIVLSILALFVGLLAVYLAADGRHGADEKIQKYAEIYSNMTKKSLDDCVASINFLSERIETLESDTENFPEFKAKVTGELVGINKKMSDIRHELITKNSPQLKNEIKIEPEVVGNF
jgi:hypothetical protein